MKLSVGSEVYIKDGPIQTFGSDIMLQYIGKKAKIISINNISKLTGISLDIDKGYWSWNTTMFDLSRMRREKIKRILKEEKT